MKVVADKALVEWLQGLGRITLLAKEAITSLFTLKVAWRDFNLPDLLHRREISGRCAGHRRVHRHGALCPDLFSVS